MTNRQTYKQKHTLANNKPKTEKYIGCKYIHGKWLRDRQKDRQTVAKRAGILNRKINKRDGHFLYKLDIPVKQFINKCALPYVYSRPRGVLRGVGVQRGVPLLHLPSIYQRVNPMLIKWKTERGIVSGSQLEGRTVRLHPFKIEAPETNFISRPFQFLFLIASLIPREFPLKQVDLRRRYAMHIYTHTHLDSRPEEPLVWEGPVRQFSLPAVAQPPRKLDP